MLRTTAAAADAAAAAAARLHVCPPQIAYVFLCCAHRLDAQGRKLGLLALHVAQTCSIHRRAAAAAAAHTATAHVTSIQRQTNSLCCAAHRSCSRPTAAHTLLLPHGGVCKPREQGMPCNNNPGNPCRAMRLHKPPWQHAHRMVPAHQTSPEGRRLSINVLKSCVPSRWPAASCMAATSSCRSLGCCGLPRERSHHLSYTHQLCCACATARQGACYLSCANPAASWLWQDRAGAGAGACVCWQRVMTVCRASRKSVSPAWGAALHS